MCLPLTRSSNAEFHQIAASQLAIDGVVVQRALTTAYACVVIKRIALMSRLREVHFGPTFCPAFDGGRSCMAASRSECPTTILLRQKTATGRLRDPIRQIQALAEIWPSHSSDRFSCAHQECGPRHNDIAEDIAYRCVDRGNCAIFFVSCHKVLVHSREMAWRLATTGKASNLVQRALHHSESHQRVGSAVACPNQLVLNQQMPTEIARLVRRVSSQGVHWYESAVRFCECHQTA